ncbi:40S ribosomal protein S10-2, partial [Linum perenne]
TALPFCINNQFTAAKQLLRSLLPVSSHGNRLLLSASPLIFLYSARSLSAVCFASLQIIPEKNRREISKYLFQEGVCYAKKDFNLAKHPDIDVPNLQVIKLMQSFKSKEYVRETFAWMHYYWYLTNDGIEFLRTYLNLPSEIVPATLKKSAKPIGDRPRFGDRDGYRSGPREGGFGGEKGGAPADYQPAFRVSFDSICCGFSRNG